jgi:hypothetical protein
MGQLLGTLRVAGLGRRDLAVTTKWVVTGMPDMNRETGTQERSFA